MFDCNRIGKVALTIAAALANGGGAIQPTFAHSIAIERQPAPDSELRVSPKFVTLVFNENVEADYSSMSLGDASGKVLVTGKGRELCKGSTCKLALPKLAPGRYQVRYEVLSRDGHVVRASYEFAVKGGAP